MKKHYYLTIKSDDRPGLLHFITGIINRRLIDIISLNAARTGNDNIVLITLELLISDKALSPLILKIENIIEVFSVEAVAKESAISLRCAFFKMDKAFLETSGTELVRRQQFSIVSVDSTTILLAKAGNCAEIDYLRKELAGSYFLGMVQSGVIVDNSLMENDAEERISGLAA